MLLTADDTRRLDRLTLASGRTAPGPGARQSRARGFGLEFEDYRPYQAGDDPRAIDWTVEARLRQLVVRVFRAEGHMRLHLLLDVSRSMTVGTPAKLTAAARVASALAYVGVERRDAVGLATFDDRIRMRIAPATGKAHLLRVLALTEGARAVGRSSPDRAFTTYAAAERGPGLAVILSDMLVPALPLEGLRVLACRGLTPVIVQVLADEDLDPHLSGPVDLADAEDPAAAPRHADPDAARRYMTAVGMHVRALMEACTSNGWPYLRVTTGMAFPQVLAASVNAGLLAVHG
jgi:uncharacterized protein (DUF58 family)